MITRRTLVRNGTLSIAGTIAGAIVSRPLAGMCVERFRELPSSSDTRMKQLIDRAVDAAMTAGASYADARLTLTQEMFLRAGSKVPNRKETMGIGVRALYDGFWGFASSPVWEPGEAARLGRAATTNARVNLVNGQTRAVELAPNASTRSGDWIMPIKDDPFVMAVEEIGDYVTGLVTYMQTLKNVVFSSADCSFLRQHKAFGSSQQQCVTQRLYRTGGSVSMTLRKGAEKISGSLDRLTMAGMGFEYWRNQPLRQYCLELNEELNADFKLPWKPVDVGRYSVLIDGPGVANIASSSIGVATEADRVMGFEANASGTSYLVEPNEMLGTFKVGSSALQVSASRSVPGGCAWVQWDDDGIEPREIQLVTDGLITNLQTNREGCGWIKPYYERSRQPFLSSGCAYTPDAIDAPSVFTADLSVTPTSTSDRLTDLRRALDHGVEWGGPSASFDFQQSTALLRGRAYEIKKGQRIARIGGAGMIFRTTEFWNNLIQLGGHEDARRIGIQTMKWEPLRVAHHSCDAPPGIFKDLSVIDILRKA